MSLVRSNGTPVTKAGLGTYFTTVPVTDPLIKIKETLYELERDDGTTFPPRRRAIRFRAGQVIRTSELLAEFPDPAVTSIAPATGPAAGGTAVQIRGANFTPGSVPKVGDVACTNIVVVNEELITCKTGAHAAGAVPVTVTTDSGTASLTAGFTFA
ncbi:IPT/TIG domain-containing protein [Actinomadura yumaensis]|uniref:IPT/TIG domain-containing protein n=1 Tax=Actinomadura yumaensis TaxID=111807 RepID=A0ABW2CS64_9ACTN